MGNDVPSTERPVATPHDGVSFSVPAPQTAPTTLVSGPRSDARRVHTIRPRRTLVRHFLAPIIALSVPLIAVLLWATIPIGLWAPVVALAVLIAVLTTLSIASYHRTTIWVDADGVTERGFFGRIQHFPASEIDRILRVEVYRGHTLDTSHQLFAVSADEQVLLRMRGEFWKRSAMDEVAAVLGVPEIVETEPITLGQLRRDRSGLLYWFEKRPFAARSNTP
ncbi:hypothetical protein [Agromyces atrinae]|uniref:PH domain-containing protein n=1 Tax=Agromyces atrinae TaxID=592376 RepID=A0A852SGW0_9MICO|nr:hypothetical protein [Agromyces atrinae]NYD66961.1 hypothetical protein [Agromyces atrinae]